MSNRQSGGSVVDLDRGIPTSGGGIPVRGRPRHVATRGLPRKLGVGLLCIGLATACDTDPAPPFTLEGEGSVEGFLFIDVDNDRLFDPGDGDGPLPDVPVSVRERGGVDVLGSGVSEDDGRFEISGLPPGTHHLFFQESAVPEGVFVCQNPVPTTVFIDQTTFTQVPARLACLITIAEAQAAPDGEFVLVRGVVTAFPGQFDEGDGVIQDETGGIWLLAASLEGEGLQVGDLVEVGGEVDDQNGLLLLQNLELRDVTPGFGAPGPVATTTGEISANGSPRDALQGLLGVVRGAELQTGFVAGGSRNATINDGSGGTILRVESVLSPNSGDGILAALGLTIGNCYDITGIISTFFGTGEIFPRTADDIEEVPCG